MYKAQTKKRNTAQFRTTHDDATSSALEQQEYQEHVLIPCTLASGVHSGILHVQMSTHINRVGTLRRLIFHVPISDSGRETTPEAITNRSGVENQYVLDFLVPNGWHQLEL